MNARVITFALGLLLAGLGTLAACSANPQPETREGTYGQTSTFWVTTIDGRRIPCVSWSAGNAGGLSCDWSLR